MIPWQTCGLMVLMDINSRKRDANQVCGLKPFDLAGHIAY